jgi:large subunit ribosomal protein L9
MEVILREDFLSLGYIGDTVRVKRGYARNFLIPRGLAVEASSANDRVLKHKLSAIVAKRIKKKVEAEQFGKIIEQVIVEFTLKVGAKGKSFGAITTKDIEASLKSLGYQVDRRQIRLVDAIRGAGMHKVEVKLHSEVVVPLQVKVIAAQPVAAATGDADQAAGKGKKKSRKKATSAEGEAGEQEEASKEASSAEATDTETTDTDAAE